MMSQFRRRRTVEDPAPIVSTADAATLPQRAHGAGDGGAMRADQIRESLMGEREGHGDAIR
jgi:hypothetical protein